jgi:hypothetical protein
MTTFREIYLKVLKDHESLFKRLAQYEKKEKEMKKRKKYGETYKIRALFSLDPGKIMEFRRVCKDKKINMSELIEQMIHDWLVKNTNGSEE